MSIDRAKLAPLGVGFGPERDKLQQDASATANPYAPDLYLQVMETRPHLLVVDDDREIRDLLTRFLEKSGFRITAVRDSREARRAWTRGAFHLVVLDLMLPGENGLDLARWLRDQEDVPIVVLSAMGRRDRPHHRSGAWRRRLYRQAVQPARTHGPDPCRDAPRARHGEAPAPGERVARPVKFAGWTLEPSRRRLLNPDGVEVPLTGGEYDLLIAMLDRANRVLTRDMLLDLLRGRQAGPFDRAIDVAISRLRRKLDDQGRGGQIIKTVRGGGLCLGDDGGPAVTICR